MAARPSGRVVRAPLRKPQWLGAQLVRHPAGWLINPNTCRVAGWWGFWKERIRRAADGIPCPLVQRIHRLSHRIQKISRLATFFGFVVRVTVLLKDSDGKVVSLPQWLSPNVPSQCSPGRCCTNSGELHSSQWRVAPKLMAQFKLWAVEHIAVCNFRLFD